jgi:hypothetical protein
MQGRAEPAGAAPGVEYPSVSGQQCVQEACFAMQIDAVGAHPAEPVDVPLCVLRTVLGEPAWLRLVGCHGSSLFGRRARLPGLGSSGGSADRPE